MSPEEHPALNGAWPRGCAVLLSPRAAHALLAALLADWSSGSGLAVLGAQVAEGRHFVIARGPDTGLEAEARAAVESELPPTLRKAFTFLSESWYDGRVSGLHDGSPSTSGVDGTYVGGWDPIARRPHGRGRMAWENGITYDGRWRDGRYDGVGRKAYSRGGGYVGQWREGARQGWGLSLYDGKWGYEAWEGPFESDAPHGVGTMELRSEPQKTVTFEFAHGEPLTTITPDRPDDE